VQQQAEGLMDGMAAFFFEMERDCDRLSTILLLLYYSQA